MKKTVCVYCGASPRISDTYKARAEEIGRALAAQNFRLVYGGGRSGLMGIIADSALEAGAEVIGIIPGHIDQREIRHEELSELHVVDSMHERKALMAEKSDMFLILPGGLGTMDEFFEIVTWRQLGLHKKAIFVYNLEGYWDPLAALVENIKNEHFMKESDLDHFKISNNFEELLQDMINSPMSKDGFNKHQT